MVSNNKRYNKFLLPVLAKAIYGSFGKTESEISNIVNYASALLMAAEGHGFEDVLLYYDHLMEHLRWKNLGHVLAGGNGDVGDIQGKKELQDAYELGRAIDKN